MTWLENMTWLIPAIVVPLVGLCIYVPLRIKGRMQPALIVKCILSVGFILYALVAGFRVASIDAVEPWVFLIVLFTLAGMVFSLLGDVWLDLKDMVLEYQRFFMFCGFSSFMIGHLFFIFGMGMAYRLPRWVWPMALLVGALIAGANLLVEKPFKLHYGDYRNILVAYAFVIGVATAIPIIYAIRLSGQPGHSLQPAIFAAGMVLFLLSDLVLSQIYFAEPEVASKPILFVLNYLFYFGAQYLLALSLYFLPYAGLPGSA